MSDKKEKKNKKKSVEKITIDNIGVSAEEQKAAEEYVFDPENFDEQNEAFFSISAFLSNASDTGGDMSSKVELKGNPSMIVQSMVSAIEGSESMRELLFAINNAIAIRRMEYITGKTEAELKEEFNKQAEEEGKIPIEKDIADKMPYNNENGMTEA